MPTVTRADLHSIDWEISSACQATCPICLRRDPTTPQIADVDQGYTSLREFKRALKHTTGIKAINFCGNIGDPMANPEIGDIVEYLGKVMPNCRVRVSTNGGIGSVENYERLAAAGVTMTFGVDGYQDVNNLHRASVKWDAIDRNIRAFKRSVSRPWQLTVQFLPFDQNIHDLPNVVAWARDVGVDTLFVKESYGPPHITVQDKNDVHTHTLTKLNTEKYRPLLNRVYPNNLWDQLLQQWAELGLSPVPPIIPTAQPIVFVRPGRDALRFPEAAPYEIHPDDQLQAQDLKSRDVYCISWDDIERQNKKVLFIFITYDLFVMPCCFVSGRFTGSRMYKGTVTKYHQTGTESRLFLDIVDAEMLNRIHSIGLDKFNLRRYSLAEILDSGVLNELVYSDLETDNKLAICGRMCGK